MEVSLRAITAMGIFLLFGAVMTSLAGSSWTWRGTGLDRIWILNPHAYEQLEPLGAVVGILLFLLSATLAVAAVGRFHPRLWGWRLALAIVGIQVLGDFTNIILGRVLQGGMGIAIAGALLIYLLQFQVISVSKASAASK